jgi:hypothetical protein
VIISDGGSNYVSNDTITLSAASFGGNPANGNITLRVGSVDGNGAVQAFAALDANPAVSGIVYTPIVLTSTFSLNEYLYTVNNIFSFSVLVDGVLQRPEIDYTFSGDSTLGNDLTFINSPAAGASILVRAEGYFEYAGTITNTVSAPAQMDDKC